MRSPASIDLRDRTWAGWRAHGAGVDATDTGHNLKVLTDGLRANSRPESWLRTSSDDMPGCRRQHGNEH